MKRDVVRLVRSVVLGAAVMLALLVAGLLLDVFSAGRWPLLTEFNVNEARHFNNLLGRGLSQLLGVTFTTVAIAVPLTANMYSLKFLEFFIKDPVNAAALTLVVFANLSNMWAGYALKDNFVPVIQFNLDFWLVLVCCALLFPYLYYIFRFLHPNTLLDRLEAEIIADLHAATRPRARLRTQRRRVAEGIEHIANIAIRSVDRSDRNTAIESVFTLKRVARTYWEIKPNLPPAWFEADPHLFLGFFSSAMLEMTASRTWVEMKLLSQMRQVMSAAIPRMHDLTSMVARSLRKMGAEEGGQYQPAVVELVMQHFNTFIRMALNRKDTRAVFSVLDQYRTFAEALNGHYPAQTVAVAKYLAYYGRVAREAKLDFIVEAVAYDLGLLVQQAWQHASVNRQPLLDCFVQYDPHAKKPLPGVKKAQAILASYFLLAGFPEPAALLRQNLSALEPEFLAALRDTLLGEQPEKYWEASERRANLDYVPEPQRAKLQEFFESLLPVVEGQELPR